MWQVLLAIRHLQFPGMFRLAMVLTLALRTMLVLLLTQQSGFSQAPLSIQIEDVECVFVSNGAVKPGTHRVGLLVKATNSSDSDVLLDRPQFRLHCAEALAINSKLASPLALQLRRLEPGRFLSAWIWFTHDQFPQGAPMMELEWQSGQSRVRVSVDEFLVAQSQYSSTVLGPQDSLLLIRGQRRLDALSVWQLANLLRETGNRRPRRLVIALDHRASNPVISDQVLRWLLRALETPRTEDVAPVPIPDCPADFLEIHLAGFRRSSSRGGTVRGSAIRVHRTEDEAVAAALGELYRHSAPGTLLDGFHSAHPGIRKAILESAIDRLTITQIRKLLSDTVNKRDEVATMVAKGLYRVPDPDVFPLLLELALDPVPQVSEAAVRSLTMHPGSEAVLAVLDLWERRIDLRGQIITSAIQSRDDRWGRLITDHAISLLRQAAGSQTEVLGETAPLPPGHSIDPNGNTTFRDQNPLDVEYATSVPATSRLQGQLQQVLGYSDPDRLQDVMSVACDVLPAVKSPGVQDVVAMFIVQHDRGNRASVIRAYIADRLERRLLSDPLGNLIYLYPDSRWTEQLLQMAESPKFSAKERGQTVHRALRCASSTQLNLFADAFDDFSTSLQGVILQQLAAAEHPQWRRLADNALARHHELFNTALEVLHNDGSEESITILHRQLQSRLDGLKDETDQQNASRLTEKLIIKVSLFSHPESRRLLNRCKRSSAENVRRQALSSLSAAARRSPANSSLENVRLLRRNGEYEAAMDKVNACIEADGLLPEAWLMRAALRLRNDEILTALSDLETANRLSPEEPGILSTIALATVRTGNVAEGLAMARQTLALDPHEESNQYNIACVYARAAESHDVTESLRSEYIRTAFRLLNGSTSTNFADPSHVLRDPDLRGLHDFDEWSAYVASVRTAAEENDSP
jgi:tetratricopeptide (TPR) repeat protein